MNILSIIAGLVLIVLSGNFKSTFEIPFSKPMMIPPEQLEHFTFGHKELISDVLWLRAVQSMDYCGSTFTVDQTVSEVNSAKICKKGWLFHMLDAATRVSPRYRIIYRRGAINLSVVTNDAEGADLIYKRGTEVYPTDWIIRYQYGFHKLFDMKDPKSAAEQMVLAGKYGAPNWATLLAAKLYSQAGQAEFGFQALGRFYGDKPFAEWPARAQERWGELEKMLGHKVPPPNPEALSFEK